MFFGLADSAPRMIRGGFLTEEDRGKLVALARDGSAASRVTRRANALVCPHLNPIERLWGIMHQAESANPKNTRNFYRVFDESGYSVQNIRADKGVCYPDSRSPLLCLPSSRSGRWRPMPRWRAS